MENLTDLAEEYNRPGEFSTLIGWEWSAIPGGANLHRVVISDASNETAQKFQPFGLTDSPYPEDLWAWLDETSRDTGADFVAIPHNSNISKGYMFDLRTLRGSAIDQDYALRRMKWEPIVEITQIKGDSETHPTLAMTIHLPILKNILITYKDRRLVTKRNTEIIFVLLLSEGWVWVSPWALIPINLVSSAQQINIPRFLQQRKIIFMES